MREEMNEFSKHEEQRSKQNKE